MERRRDGRKAMRKRWIEVLCVFFAAGMLMACGGTENKIQMVEEESIAPPPVQESGGETAGEEEERAQEEAVSSVEEAETPGGSTQNAPETPAAQGPAEVTIKKDKKEYKDGERTIMVTVYEDVTVTMEVNEAAAQAVTAEFAKRKEAFEKGLLLEETLEQARENPVVDGSLYYSEEQWYTLERNDGRVLSFSAMWDSYKGGAHGQYMVYGVNFDAGTGQLLAIADIAQDKAAFQEICVQEMLRQCENLKAQGLLFAEEMITPSLKEVLEGKMEGNEWYFTENGIRFISNVYEIAPYAAGSIDFDIPYEMVNEVLKEAYRR